MAGIEGKVCTKCRTWKLLEEFSFDDRNKDGRQSCCKKCYNEQRRCRRATDLEYREELRERDRQRYPERRERKAGYNAQYYEENREEILEQQRQHYVDNPEPYKERAAGRRALKAGAEGFHTRAEFQALCEQCGWVCPCCGTPHSESSLTRDHIGPLSQGGSDDISNIQPLCGHCNDSKGTKAVDYRQDLGMLIPPDF